MGESLDKETGVSNSVSGESRSAIVIGAGEAVAAALRRDGVDTVTSFDGRLGHPKVAVFVARDRPATSLASESAAAFREGMGGDLKAAFAFLKSATEVLRAGGSGGSVVFVAPGSAHTAHDAARQGLRLLVKAAALELGPEHIRVNIVLPGDAVSNDDIANAVAFLASDRALFMTGADMVVDGGRMAR